ncbi:MAG: HAMP domain-containing sensor histidine kinase [Bacteroidia bacterium]|nr:HAMP domain-containing sensor histidine kinase [Bacteroidia bacterium]
MIRLKSKLALFNLLSKLVFTALFLIFLPLIIERINLRQVDNDLIQKREKTIGLIEKIGIKPFIISDTTDAFGSYNILKEEFISLERTNIEEELNQIDVSNRIIEDEEITYRVLNYTLIVDGQKYLLEIGKSLASIQNTKKNIYRIILVFLVFIILVTLVTDLQYTRIILNPLKKIISKLKEISSPSKFDMTPVKTNTSDFASLDNALRDLMIQIDESFQKEKETTVNISHELMTPISVLRSKLENILLRSDLDPETANKIEESLKTLHRLQSLVNSLLLIARIESHQYLREDTFSVQSLLEEIFDELIPVAVDKEVILKGDFIKDYQFEKANRSLIFSMFNNVLNNAIKNTDRGGKITLTTSIRQERYLVTISDTGKGINEAQMSTLFSRFKTRNGYEGDGTGIGLAISKSIADFHKIEVSVTSEIEKGTTFSFIFPETS